MNSGCLLDHRSFFSVCSGHRLGSCCWLSGPPSFICCFGCPLSSSSPGSGFRSCCRFGGYLRHSFSRGDRHPQRVLCLCLFWLPLFLPSLPLRCLPSLPPRLSPRLLLLLCRPTCRPRRLVVLVIMLATAIGTVPVRGRVPLPARVAELRLPSPFRSLLLLPPPSLLLAHPLHLHLRLCHPPIPWPLGSPDLPSVPWHHLPSLFGWPCPSSIAKALPRMPRSACIWPMTTPCALSWPLTLPALRARAPPPSLSWSST